MCIMYNMHVCILFVNEFYMHTYVYIYVNIIKNVAVFTNYSLHFIMISASKWQMILSQLNQLNIISYLEGVMFAKP